MKLRFTSLGPIALLASSMMLAFSANAASQDEGIVIITPSMKTW
jgi:iron(III) transport system substrate-binding protein